MGKKVSREWSPSSILMLIRTGAAVTRGELSRRTGLSRSTISQRVDDLLTRGLVHESGQNESTGGRPSTVLTFNQGGGVILAADLGAAQSWLIATDLSGALLAEDSDPLPIDGDPVSTLLMVEKRFDTLLGRINRENSAVRGVGLSLLGPVAFGVEKEVTWTTLPGWRGYPIKKWLNDRYGVPVILENDDNLRALAEHRTVYRHTHELLFAKVGTYIGSGLIINGEVHRGTKGTAGDIGHVKVGGRPEAVCICGNTGCLEANIGSPALARWLRDEGVPVSGDLELKALLSENNPGAMRIMREAGRLLGEVLATAVNFLNPEVIVVDSEFGGTQQLLAGAREVIFQRSLPLATRDLQIVASQLRDRGGALGAAIAVAESLLLPDAED